MGFMWTSAKMLLCFGGSTQSTMTPSTDKPLVMWLQGGPGGSSTGFGNFEEIGPLTVDLKPRETTWLNEANLLFVDNPVGAGFSYVTDEKAYTTNVTGLLNEWMFVCVCVSLFEKNALYWDVDWTFLCTTHIHPPWKNICSWNIGGAG